MQPRSIRSMRSMKRTDFSNETYVRTMRSMRPMRKIDFSNEINAIQEQIDFIDEIWWRELVLQIRLMRPMRSVRPGETLVLLMGSMRPIGKIDLLIICMHHYPWNPCDRWKQIDSTDVFDATERILKDKLYAIDENYATEVKFWFYRLCICMWPMMRTIRPIEWIRPIKWIRPMS